MSSHTIELERLVRTIDLKENVYLTVFNSGAIQFVWYEKPL